MTFPLWAQLAAFLAAAMVPSLVAIAAAWWLAKARPVSLERKVRDLASTVSLHSADNTALRQEWHALRAGLEAFEESVTDTLEAVETKRRRTAARASKMEQKEASGFNGDPDSQEGLRHRARALGIDGI